MHTSPLHANRNPFSNAVSETFEHLHNADPGVSTTLALLDLTNCMYLYLHLYLQSEWKHVSYAIAK